MTQPTVSKNPTLQHYLVGFVLALVLTAIPFAMVSTGVLARAQTLAIIALAAIAQILVHLRFFLHLDFVSTPRENLIAILFAGILILIMLGGSFWIMFDLHYRMSI